MKVGIQELKRNCKQPAERPSISLRTYSDTNTANYHVPSATLVSLNKYSVPTHTNEPGERNN